MLRPRILGAATRDEEQKLYLKNCFRLLLLCLASTWVQAAAGHQLASNSNGCAHYLSNAGVLVSVGDSKVLFDAFYSDSYGRFALLSEETYAALLNNQPPYDQIDALFISHAHGDHFSLEPTLAFLKANAQVQVYTSSQVIDQLTKADAGLASRLHAFELKSGEVSARVKLGALEIDAARLPHVGGERTATIENLAFRVTLNNQVTVMHLGDADPVIQVFAPLQSHWDAKVLDVSFPPYWFLSGADGKQILDEHLNSKSVIGVHVPTEAMSDAQSWRSEHAGDLFIFPGETRAINSAECESSEVSQPVQ